jgi:hypothetical protein
MVNSVLASLPMFYLCSLKIYKWVIEEVDKYRIHYLWRDKDLQKKTPPLASWDLVCQPKDQGGLRILNLLVQNDCLLMKHPHKFYSRADLPLVKMSWELYYAICLPPARTREVSFWWRDFLKMLRTFKILAECDFIQGNSIFLWKDRWAAHTLKETWPHLYSFCKDEDISISQALPAHDMTDLFHLPLSEEALLQFQLFQAMLLNLELAAGFDVWTVFGNFVATKASRVYKYLMDLGDTIRALKWMRKGCCQQKHKVFFWPLIHNRLNTRAMLQMKNFFHG